MSHTIDELHQLQALPLEAKISATENRIREWVNQYGLDGVYISFSGGKDSTVLLHIARKIYPDMKGAYIDTGLEYPEIRSFVQTFNDIDWVKPKMTFRQVIEKYGYPFISKEVSQTVYGSRRYLKKNLMGGGSTDAPELSENWACRRLFGLREYATHSTATIEALRSSDRRRQNGDWGYP